MLMNKIAATPALTIALMGAGTGSVHAGPAGDGGVVGYTASLDGRSAIITTDAGSLVDEGGVFKIKAVDGTTLAGAELSFRVDDFVFPIDADISGLTATLTPRFDMDHATYQPVAMPFEDTAPWQTPYEREQAAWGRMLDTISLGATVGAIVGGIGGAAVGCVLGGLGGAAVASAAIVGLFGAFLPAAVVGCIGGMIAVGPLGVLAGQLFITAPVAIFAAVQYFTTISAPFVPPVK
ncbi:hypothetical protein [Nocardia terpenica]|uniref:DUF8020 domain-containing protein n=1 Tax=Nocardia terpenica TaxID=455432 RepID=A0A291RPQ1_9NOCA|nr:hypothetical protein [Nocardia terpenica]ATL69184.1 hypothetical protein CRH09_26395 [Nocardia terpenica]